jgi:hypothetical protein
VQGKTLSELCAEMFCPSLFFAITLPMVGVEPYAGVVLWLIGLIAYQTSSGLGMLVSVAAQPAEANMIASSCMTLCMNAGGFLFDKAKLPLALQWLPFTSYYYYMMAVCVEAVTGETNIAYSQLSFGANLAISCCFAFSLRFAVYLALKFTPKYNFG